MMVWFVLVILKEKKWKCYAYNQEQTTIIIISWTASNIANIIDFVSTIHTKTF